MQNQRKVLKPLLALSALAVFIALSAPACSYRSSPQDAQTSARPAARDRDQPGYSTVRTQVFEAHCIRCHGNSGGVNLETYASARSALNQISDTVVVKQSMPPSGPLSPDLIALVQAWVDAGGPENDTPRPSALAPDSPQDDPVPSS